MLSSPSSSNAGLEFLPLDACICPACDHANPRGARYCNACGAPVHLRACPACEAINDGDGTHCYKCGGALDDVGAEAAPPPEPDMAQPLFPNLVPLRECPQCEAVNDVDASFCHACEAPLGDLASDAAPAMTETPHDVSVADDPLDERSPAVELARSTPSTPVEPRETLIEQFGQHAATDEIPARSSASAIPSNDDAPRHFIGPLTAPTDEAELSQPEVPAPPRTRRGPLVASAIVALLVLPALVAVGYHALESPATRDRLLASVPAFTGAPLRDAKPTEAAPPPAASQPADTIAATPPPPQNVGPDDTTPADSPPTPDTQGSDTRAASPLAAPTSLRAQSSSRARESTRPPARTARTTVARVHSGRETLLRGATPRTHSTRAVAMTARQPARVPQRLAAVSAKPRAARCSAAASAMGTCRPSGPFDFD